jgi:N-acetylmuramoyl-L-alanine amidase
MLIILTILITNLFNKHKTTEIKLAKDNSIVTDPLEHQILLNEANLTETILKSKTEVAKRYITQINSEIEYIALTESGKQSVYHEKSKESDGLWQKYLENCNINIGFDYKAVLSIKTKYIVLNSDNGVTSITYNPSDITVKSIDISNIISKVDKGIFSKGYSNQESLSLLEIAKDNLNNQISSDTKLKKKAEENLNTYFIDMANKCNVTRLSINGKMAINKGYTFLFPGTIKHNHPSVGLQSIKYIVIHSTAVKDVDALQWYDRLNSKQTDRGTSAHFFADDKNIVQTIPTNLKSYNCGLNNKIADCDNNSSLSIEIAEFTDKEHQQKAIENTVDFVNNVLKAKYPDTKIVLHRDLDATACPEVLTDEQFEKYFNK